MAETQIIKCNFRAVELQVLQCTTERGSHVECVLLARILNPRLARTSRRNEAIDVGFFRGKIQRQHDGAERPDVLDPRLLSEKRRKIVVRDNNYRMLGRVP